MNKRLLRALLRDGLLGTRPARERRCLAKIRWCGRVDAVVERYAATTPKQWLMPGWN